jgi:hypothetical protein
MDWSTARDRFLFLATALDGLGGFRPTVRSAIEVMTDGKTREVPELFGPCYLDRYPRESAEKLAGRAKVAQYINHLDRAVGRFTSFLGRRRPLRAGVDGPLMRLLVQDADMRGSPLDRFWSSFAREAKARGSMLLVIDMARSADGQRDDGGPAVQSLGDQIRLRAVPYLRAVPPEYVTSYSIDSETGAFEAVSLSWTEDRASQRVTITRSWDAQGWQEHVDGELTDADTHPFGVCPVIAFTEDGGVFPRVGRYAQIADISRRLFNARSERDELLRSQTFSLLTYPVSPEAWSTWEQNRDSITATIGTHSMLVHMAGGQSGQPSFIAPPNGPIEAYGAAIAELEEQIRVLSHADSTADGTSPAESGLARRQRFEALNADLTHFASQMQALEMRVWALFARGLGIANTAAVEWPSDFNLADISAELDILDQMQVTGFPPIVLQAKRRAIAAIEFDAADEKTKAAVMAAVDEQTQESATGATP